MSSDQTAMIIGTFILSNAGTIFAILKSYHLKELALAERLVRIESKLDYLKIDIDGVARHAGTDRSLGESKKLE